MRGPERPLATVHDEAELSDPERRRSGAAAPLTSTRSRMRATRSYCLPVVLTALLATAGCVNDQGSGTPVEPAGGTLNLGQALIVDGGRSARVAGEASGGEFIAVVANITLEDNARGSITFGGTGLGAPKPAGPFGVRVPSEPSTSVSATARGPARDDELEERMHEREKQELASRFGAARAARSSLVPSLPATVAVGDVVRLNVSANVPCTSGVFRGARVMAVGTKALILEDTLNPKPGFSAADYQRYAAKFDTLIYPAITGAFGEPSDIDKNGRVAIVFTRTVNELTTTGAGTYVSGITASRDLFPQTGGSSACAGSNEGEYEYVLAPDPAGTINGNVRTNEFVDTSTTTVLAHELVHLINASRKLYVNPTAQRFEVTWLDEGLAHIGEELLFYRAAGLAPRQNLTYRSLRASARTLAAYQSHMAANASRYSRFLSSTASSSPYASVDVVTTRGASWSLLRYLADRTAPADGTIWSRLIDSPVVGFANVRAVFGSDLSSMVRDWSASNALDDRGAVLPEHVQQSWNFHSIYGGVDELAPLYPLPFTNMNDGSAYSGSIEAGGSLFFRFTVPANATATLSLNAPSAGTTGRFQMVIVRTK